MIVIGGYTGISISGVGSDRVTVGELTGLNTRNDSRIASATPSDGVKVEQTGPMQLKVTFNQWGNWWHRNGIGASSYENEYYKAEILDYPYQVTFKQFPEGSVIIYQDGPEWKEFKLDSGQ